MVVVVVNNTWFWVFQLKYVLDTNRPGNELIVCTFKASLTRSDFLTLGLMQQMESTVS